MLARAFKQATTRFSSAPAARKLHTSRRAQAVPPVPTSADLAAKDAQLSSSAAYKAARAKFTVAATKASIQKTMQSLEEKGHIVDVVATKHDALKKIQHVIPKGASINLTGSTTLGEIGFVDYITSHEGQNHWVNLKAKVLAEKDAAKQAKLRRQAATSDFALSTVDALTETGEFIAADASGTRVVVFHAAEKVVLVVGSQKIVKDLPTAHQRLQQYVYETESARIRATYPGMPGSTIANLLESRSAPFATGHFHFIIVEEQVGF